MGFLITMGTLGDRIGRRRLLMIGAVDEVHAALDRLQDLLLSHAADEENEVVEPLGRLNVGG